MSSYVGLAALAAALSSAASAQADIAAQATTAVSAAEVAEIVVTAQKRSESLQKVPLAITAITASELERSGIRDLQGVAATVPGLNLGEQLGVAKITLRGIGLESLQPGAEGSIAFHVDGIFISRSVAALASFYDIQQVEVLRGPQGTLYGRNATGGSINITTRGPTEELSGYASLTAGNYNQIVAEGAVGGAIIPDVLSARVAFQTQDHDGYGKNVVTGNEIDDLNSRAIRGSLRFTPNDRLTVDLKADYYRRSDHSGGYHYLGGGAFSAPGVPITPFGLTLFGGQAPSNRRDLANNVDPTNRVRFWGASGRISYELSDEIDLVSLTAYRKLKYQTLSDIDSTSAPIAPIYQAEQDRQFSQEFQITGNHDRLNWLVGLFYFNENDRGQLAIPFDNFAFFPPPTNYLTQGYWGGGFIKTKAMAVFGQATYKLSDVLRLTVGGRYSTEKKRALDQFLFDVATPFDASTPANLVLQPPAGTISQPGSERFNSFTPRIALDYQVTPDVLLYASWSKGFKSGTYSLGTLSPPVNPEKVSAFEGGMKSTLFDRRVRLNLAGFYYKYSDLQVGKVEDQSTVLENAATATIYGLEAELQVRPVERVRIDANAAWLHARFDEYVSRDLARPFGDGTTLINGNPAFNLAGNTLSQSPNFTFFAGAQYTLPTGAGDFTLRGEISYRDRSYLTAFNVPYLSQPSFAKLNAFLNWTSVGEKISGSLFVRNITNKTTVSSAYVSSGLFGFPINGYLEEPRTYGATIRYAF
ncbi:TonB-dependent receptor [Sphingomonas sp. SRS2]|uniref:TonB-dependent receptor n=1 Tax=Sphingomonas sp. SRS2 TaxID=133190 RepID=UPI0006184C9A|nr:TonB-dependent receptor [Sphingomonas sp. SRS2]KKC24172.1 TonB-dependent receptor [Sphingomonas sp. SRS2]